MMILIKQLKNIAFLDAELLHRVSVLSSVTSCHSALNPCSYFSEQNPRHFSTQQIIIPDIKHHSFLKGKRVPHLSHTITSCHYHNGFQNMTQPMNGSVSSHTLYKVSLLNMSSIMHQKFFQKRHKGSKKQSSTDEDLSDSDDDALEEDDFQAPPKFKVMKIHAPSLRSDAIVSHSLDVARNRLEEAFFGSGILLNGEKMSKKAVKMDEGDYVDLVMEKVEDQLKVKRVKILKIYPERTSNDKFIVKIRVWKSPFLVANPKKEHRDS